jgi:copper homeostasis protein
VTPPGRILIEVAVESVDDAVAAEQGGADRLELCAALDLGGLTPSLGAYLEVRAAARLPVWVMIRPRPGDFVYTEGELRVMTRDIEAFGGVGAGGPDGFVFGVLREDGSVDSDRCGLLRQRAGDRPCAFHRAFDKCPDPHAALDRLVQLGFCRVLTSGREETAAAGARAIASAVRHAAGRIEVLPCGRIRAADVEDVVRLTGCHQVHGSFSEAVPAGKGRGQRGYPVRHRTSRAAVAAARVEADKIR